MDAKDLRIEPALSERNNDASKYAQSGTALQSNRNKSYQDIGSNTSAKVDAATVRPCAVIGPDRVVPPNDHNDAYLKKASVEPWPCSDTPYHRPPDYPLKAAAAVYHNPTRNISPRQTFQENMQRIMVPPTYNSAKINDDASFIQKLNGTSDAKYCDVPYIVNPITNDPKNIRSVEMCLPSVNPALGRPAPHGWPPGGINVRAQRPYVPSEMYQFPEYPSCAGPRPVSISRPHRTIPEESAYMYPEPYYQEPNIRFKPYPNVKDRYPQQRYDYIANYSNPFHPPCPPQKYEIPKSLPPHPYSTYPHFKYVDSRMPEPMIEGYQRPVGQQGSYNIAYRNQIVHPAYGPVMSNNSQSKISPYPPDGSFKPMASNKLPYDSNGKIYVEYDNARMKSFAPSESFYSNEIPRHHAIPKGAMPNYSSMNVQSIPPNSYYKKDNSQLKNYEYINHLKNLNPSININSLVHRHMPQFSPNTLAISPTDSNTSNDTSQTHGTSQEDCGYVSQSSTTSIRSTEMGHNKIPNDYYGRYYDPKYGPIIRPGPTLTKLNRSGNSSSIDNKDKKEMDVRKFLQMWNEGDEDNAENSTNKEIVVQTNSNELSNISKQHGVINNQEQLYVLGLVNVPSEDLSKYEHIQKVSKLPENIKGYNSIELLNQFEEVIESSNLNSFKLSTPKDFQNSHKPCTPKQTIAFLPRPISPLDVEAKISQSVIHKEVGCNFEIKPCSPKMLNVEIAAPVQNILNERVIEKVTNPLSMIASPILNRMGENIEHCKIPSVVQDQRMMEESEEISSCKMINTQFSNADTNSIKANYSIQDFETNAGVCLASLPRLDNDIELNFPEVNQQFINANKGEPVMSTQITDLPELKVVDHTGKVLRNVKPDSFASNELSPKVETEREFTKLSKYRKNKTNGSDGRQDKLALKTAAFRTDSVIIKNPENIKALEIHKDQSNMNKTVQMNHPNTVDLISQVESVVDVVPDINIENDINFSNTSINSSEEAIDFRLNKNVLQFEINNSIETGCEAVQLNKEEDNLTKSVLCDNTNEVIKSLKTDKDITTDIVPNHTDADHGILSTERDPNDDILTSTMLFQSASYASNPTIENSCSSDTVNELDESADFPNINSQRTQEINTNENEMLKLQISNENGNKTLKVTINDKDPVEPKVDHIPNSEIDVEHKSNIISDLPFEECNLNQPKDDNMKTLDSVESPKTNLCPDESNIQQKEVTAENLRNKLINEVITVQTNEHKSEDSAHDESMDLSTAIINEQIFENKQDSVLHSENVIFCDSKYGTQVTDSSNTDEGFESIDEKQNSQEMPICLNDPDAFQSDKILELTKHFKRCFGYGGKELYSPWIQNLIMFNEGLCRALSSDEIKPSPLDNRNSLDNAQLEIIASVDDCTIETVNTTKDCNTIDNKIVDDASLHSKNEMLTDTNAILFSLESGHLNDHLEDNNGNNRIQEIEFENDPNSNVEINSKIVTPNTGEEHSLVEELQAELNVNICTNLMHQNETEKTKFDTITEVSNDKHDVNMELEIISEPPSNPTTDERINESLVNESDIDTSSDAQYRMSTKTANDNAIKEVLLEEQDENSQSKIISEIEDEEIQERVLDKPDRATCIDSISNAAICEANEETRFCIELEDSKQVKNIEQECKNKKEENACKFNMIGNKYINTKTRKSLKRSLSDSALNILHSEQERSEEVSVVWPFKRSKLNTDSIDESDIIAQNLCNILQNNRRNSISAVYNEDNVSFCILIEDNTIITEDNEDAGKICYTEISEDCLNEINNTYGCEDVDVTIENTPYCEEMNDNDEEITENQEEKNCDYSDSVALHDEDSISLHRTWVEDVACVETVVSDDIAEDIVISSASTPREIHFWDTVDSNYYENSDKEDIIVASSPRFDDGVNLNDSIYHEICESPQINNSEIFISNGTQDIEVCQGVYDNESLERILSEPNSQPETHSEETTCVLSDETLKNQTDGKVNKNFDIISESLTNTKYSGAGNKIESKIDQDHTNSEKCEKMQDGTVHSCESSIDNVFSYKHREENANYATSSSPEVSSTTSEEKSSGILLKITNYNGSKVSQINRFNTNSDNRISCKFTEKTDYANPSHHPNRPLITKAAQKYIPPIKETIHDLKVKLSLPAHSLLKLKQIKTSKDVPKQYKPSSHPSILPKKPKPKFEDVLKSIDEIQIKMHKEKNKKVRKTIPKVVIKKNENGSHYASTSNKDTFNPDLTGRKWQPWVFLEKNHFIDKMATRKKTRAIFNHRKNAYVLAEKFHKYKSASSTKFVISQPKLSESSTGQLKYTIRLKHSY